MKYSEAIDLTDKRTPNQYDSDDKMRWLLFLDQQIYDDLIAQHEQYRRCVRPESCTGDDSLLVPDPYAEDVYVSFLQSKIAKENEEDAKYNRAITLYNDAYSRYARRYHETHRSLPRHSYFRF